MAEGLEPGTVISMADGQYVSLEDVKVGDDVFSYDAKSKEFKPSKVVGLDKVEMNTLYRIRAKEQIECSPGMKIMLSDGNTKVAKDIKEGDKIVDEYGQVEEVKNVEKVEKPLIMLSILVEDGSFVADGFVVISE